MLYDIASYYITSHRVRASYITLHSRISYPIDYIIQQDRFLDTYYRTTRHFGHEDLQEGHSEVRLVPSCRRGRVRLPSGSCWLSQARPSLPGAPQLKKASVDVGSAPGALAVYSSCPGVGCLGPRPPGRCRGASDDRGRRSAGVWVGRGPRGARLEKQTPRRITHVGTRPDRWRRKAHQLPRSRHVDNMLKHTPTARATRVVLDIASQIALAGQGRRKDIAKSFQNDSTIAPVTRNVKATFSHFAPESVPSGVPDFFPSFLLSDFAALFIRPPRAARQIWRAAFEHCSHIADPAVTDVFELLRR